MKTKTHISIILLGYLLLTVNASAQFYGGAAVGYSSALLGDMCELATLEPFHGGTGDGFGVFQVGSSCEAVALNPFFGGEADGYADIQLGVNCDTETLEPFAGGIADGFGSSLVGTPCIAVALNPFFGGEADGYSEIQLGVDCATETLEPFAGGIADGFGSSLVGTPCIAIALNPFFGGEADGYSEIQLGVDCATETLEPFAGGEAAGFTNFAYLLPGYFDEEVCGTPLPVQLLFFDAFREGTDKVKTEWITMNERNNDYFAVERSLDGYLWEDLGTVLGAGNSNTQLNYVWYDMHPKLGVLYYRLRQNDFNGQFTHSETRTVIFEDSQTITLHPNPTAGTVNMYVVGEELQHATLQILSPTGQIVHELDDFTGTTHSFDLSNYQKGVYLLRIQHKAEIKVFKIIRS